MRNKYEPSINSICVTALNILDGVDQNKYWKKLQLAWDDAGMGFDGFCGWITDIAVKSDEMLAQRDPQDFPGVYDYVVSYPLGESIRRYMLERGTLPPEEEVVEWLSELADAFFEEGEGHTLPEPVMNPAPWKLHKVESDMNKEDCHDSERE